MKRAIGLAASCWLACILAACGDDDDGLQRDASVDASAASDGGSAGGSGMNGDAGKPPADAGAPDAHMPAAPDASPVCSADGFCWELPTPQGETLRAVWASAPDDVWAVGDGGLVLHYDGHGFRAETALTQADLFAVHGSAADDVWAVGQGGVALHYDGSGWTSMDELAGLVDASGGSMTAALYGVFAAAKDAVWAVGYSGVAPVIVHYDGERFTNQALALQTDKPLRAVWGVSSGRVWAVGDGGAIRSFDGSQWNVEMSPTPAGLTSVHALTDHDVWAVGAAGSAVHWDGTRWTLVNTGLTSTLFGVRVDIDTEPPSPDAAMVMPEPMPEPLDAGMDASLPPAPEGPWRVWAFGDDGHVTRFNGSEWAELPTGSALALYGVAQFAPGSLFAVGEHGQITRFEGDALQSLTHGSHRNHLALWGDGETLWSVGDEIARRDLHGWSELERPTDRSLYGVWGDATGGLWAAGTEGTIVRYEDGELRVLDVAAAAGVWLRGVWGADNSVWVVGQGGLALINAAGGFLAVDTKVRSNLLDVWGSRDDAFWAVGEGGVVLRWDGIAWLKVPTGPMGGVVQSLQAVWGSAADDVWVVGTESTILHWDGTRFESMSRGERYTLNDVWGSGPDDVYAVGTGGTALRYDGTDWTELETGTRSALQSVFVDAQGRVFAAGLDGVVLVHEP